MRNIQLCALAAIMLGTMLGCKPQTNHIVDDEDAFIIEYVTSGVKGNLFSRDDKVFVCGQNSAIYALNLENGAQHWKRCFGEPDTRILRVDETGVWVKSAGRIFVLNHNTGMSQEISEHLIINEEHDLVSGEYCYDVISEPEGIFLIKKTLKGKGQAIWTIPINRSPSTRIHHSQGLLYLGTEDGDIICFDAQTGTRKWRHEFRKLKTTEIENRLRESFVIESKDDLADLKKEIPFRKTKVIATNHNSLLLGAIHYGLYVALDKQTGKYLWECDLQCFTKKDDIKPLCSDSKIILFGIGKTTCVDIKVGVLWSKNIDFINAQPQIVGDCLYVPASKVLHIINIEDGTVKKQLNSRNRIQSIHHRNTLLIGTGGPNSVKHISCFTRSGGVLAIDPEKQSVIWERNLASYDYSERFPENWKAFKKGFNGEEHDIFDIAYMWEYLPEQERWTELSDEDTTYYLEEARKSLKRYNRLNKESCKNNVGVYVWVFLGENDRQNWSGYSDEKRKQLIAEAEKRQIEKFGKKWVYIPPEN